MNRRSMLVIIPAAVAFAAGTAAAQQLPDVEGVKTASKAFYAALAALDGGVTMGKVWANTSYITYVGPRDKTITVGWDAQKKVWEETDKLFSERKVAFSDQHIHVNGNLAWEMGLETGESKLKDGTARKIDWFATNVYEKIDGRWLMVSHHVQPKPQ
jgi:ketosteroid isomerase-like protein